LLILSKNQVNNQKHLAYIMLCYSAMLAYYVMYWVGLVQYVPSFLGVLGGLTFVIAPLYYQYLKIRLQQQNKNTWKHGIPMLLFLTLFTLSQLSSSDVPNHLIPITQIIHMASYAILIFVLLKKFELNSFWLKSVASSYFALTIGFTGYYCMVWTGILRIEYDYFISLIMSAFIYYVGYHGFLMRDPAPKVQSSLQRYSPLYTNSMISKIESWIESSEKFLNSEYKYWRCG